MQNNNFYVIISVMFQDVIQLLTRMGLKQKDASVYLSCLHFKEGLYIHEIVTETKIHRSTVDVCLERLKEASFISSVKVGARHKYFAQSPEALLLKQENLTEDLKSLLPLLSHLGADKGDTEIRFFEGKKGIAQIYDDVLLNLKFTKGETKELVGFSSGTDVMKIYPELRKTFIEKRIKMGAWYKAIVPQTSLMISEYTSDAQELRAIKTLKPENFPFRIIFETYADSVMIYSPTKPLGGVIIRNHKIARSMRTLFYLVWNMLPEST